MARPARCASAASRSTVYERAPQLGEVGAGIQLGPNAVRVLRALGLFETLRPLTAEPSNSVSLAWDDAHLRYREPMKGVFADKFGAPYVMAHRADLHRVLCEHLPAECIRLDTRCTGVAARNGAAVADFADGSQIEADVIVGADGINSTVRESLFGVQPVRFTQQMAWRCIVPIERVPTEVGIARDEYVGWIGPNGHVICYPIRGGALYNIFAGHVTDQWVEESWAVPSSVDELLAGYRGWHPALLEMLSPGLRLLQMGHPRPRSAAALDRRADHAARRRRASDDADAGAGRLHGAGGRLCAGAAPGAAPRRSGARACRLRGRAAAARLARGAAGAPAVPEQPQEPGAAAVVARLDFRPGRHRRAGAGGDE